ncbi:DUF6171 family protein [Lapidilactobacillus wuchangensis]|uniref:DUF6171 family protein n=1 Tax=Lapidilactobacillus wuchangensis TaxID=2486001 RepID=UPI000F772D41
MSKRQNNCIRCDLLEGLDRQDTEALIDEQLALEVGHFVTDDLREQRLAICRTCPFFQNGLCQKCGCYCRFRASLNNKKCPLNKW